MNINEITPTKARELNLCMMKDSTYSKQLTACFEASRIVKVNGHMMRLCNRHILILRQQEFLIEEI